jgi:hypothetical protein
MIFEIANLYIYVLCVILPSVNANGRNVHRNTILALPHRNPQILAICTNEFFLLGIIFKFTDEFSFVFLFLFPSSFLLPFFNF